jgi:polyhydroxybutyrate depolymerase
MSNGATMTNHLGCVMSDVFAAIAPVAGGHTAHGLCEAQRPVPVLVFHGTDDEVIPYGGDDSGTPAVHDWVEAWALRNSCDSISSIAGSNPDIQLETWGNCDENATVQLYTIDGGRHDWPGSGFGPGPWPEGMSPAIYATDVIWEFFQAHPKPPSAQAGIAAGSGTTAAPSEKYQQPGDYLDYLTIDGVPRLFAVHLPPSYRTDRRLPLVVNLHAYTRTMFEQEEVSGMNAKADQEGFVVVHPQALNDPPSWWGPLPGEQGQPDRDFFRALLPYLQRRLAIDPARIYATGLSNGGTMTHRLGCDMPDTFAAIAPVAGGHTAYDQCAIDEPISVLVIHGTDDQVIPYYGQDRMSAPVHVWVEAWAERNGCHPEPSVNSMDELVTQELWLNCDQGVEVALYTLEGGGHTWPGSFVDMISGTSFPYINATDLIWEFFESHPKPAESLGFSH